MDILGRPPVNRSRMACILGSALLTTPFYTTSLIIEAKDLSPIKTHFKLTGQCLLVGRVHMLWSASFLSTRETTSHAGQLGGELGVLLLDLELSARCLGIG